MSIINDLIVKGKLKKGFFSDDMCKKEFEISKRDLSTAIKSFEDENYKWSTIQAYYAIFHSVRALLYKAGYREESHSALKLAFKELYIRKNLFPEFVLTTLERGMNLREMADYKESYSQSGADNLIASVKKSIDEIGTYFELHK